MIGLELIASLLVAAHGELYLEIDGCADVSHEEVRRLVGIEMDVELANAPGLGVPSASIRCEGTRAILSFDRESRTLDLAKVDPRARPRLLALALAELSEHPAAPPPPIVETSSISKRSAIEATTVATGTSTVDLHLTVTAFGGLTFFSSTGPPLFGGRATIELVPDNFGARLDFGAHYGSKNVDEGDVSLLSVAGGLSAFTRFFGGVAVFDVGGGARVGFARVRGTPNDATQIDGATVSGAWFGPFLNGRAAFVLGPIALALDVEAGLVIRPVVGRTNDVPIVAADGAWFAVHLGLGMAP